MVEELKYCLQLMVTIRTLAGYVQKQIKLGGSWPGPV